jgi:GNAT superfamily N-acetyltransferase
MQFQGFGEELKHLPGEYAPPRGLILLAFLGQTAAGAIALRPLGETTCEAKRLYVRPQYRRRKLGGLLLSHAIQSAHAMGYSVLYGDTLPSMKDARALYARFGFQETGPYSNHPTPGAMYLKLPLMVRENSCSHGAWASGYNTTPDTISDTLPDKEKL